MSKKLLVTTSLKQTWNNDKMIFLGPWCDNEGSFKKLNEDNFEIYKYHWDDRDKLVNDYKYLNNLYNKVLLSLILILNKYHSVNFSKRYWKIVIGPWLITFLQIIFERHSNLNYFFKDNLDKNLETIILKTKNDELIPKNYEEFTRLMLSDTWNHHIYSLLINNDDFKYPIKKIFKDFVDDENYKEYLIKNTSFKNKIYNKFVGLVENFISPQKILISESYLGLKDEFKLSLNYLTLPRYSLNYLSQNSKNLKLREKINLEFIAENSFENFIKKNIFKFMPNSFLEDFNAIGNIVDQMKWPKNPKIIFTSHFMTKTLQSRYTAECLEKKSCKLVLGQHGGVYGQYLFSSMQDYEIDIADKYLSWGWKNENKKILPFGVIKNLEKNKYDLKNSKLLMILRSQTRYTHRLNSYSGSNQIKKYFNECLSLCVKLNKKLINENLILRFHSRKFGWDEDKIFKEKLGNINMDMGYEKISNLFSSAKLVLHTYIGTGYLETLASNIPTIIFANTKECLLNKETTNDLEILKNCNIFHEDYVSAANFINFNWNKINLWWFSEKVQKAREDFCNKYSKINYNKINNLKDIFQSIIKDEN